MEKETKVTAEEIEKIQKHWYSRNPSHELDPEGNDMFWYTLKMLFDEFADLKCAPLIKELEELKQQADKMAEVLELVANYQSNQASVFQINKSAISALTDYKQTKH